MNRTGLLAAAMVAMLAGIASAQYRTPSYLMGGVASTLSTHWNGVWLADLKARSITSLTRGIPVFDIPCLAMDADNRRVVFTADGTQMPGFSSYLQSGVYRVDPATFQVTTVAAHTLQLFSPTHLLVNPDGDYVLTVRTSLIGAVYNVMKVSGVGGVLTTVFGISHLPGAEKMNLGINMDTGNYLVTAFRFLGSPQYPHTVLDVAEDGTWTTFAGATYGWDSTGANLQQDFDTGALVGQADNCLYQLMPGAATRTTLAFLPTSARFVLEFGSLFDLQSAAAPRIVASGHVTTLVQGRVCDKPAVFTIDARPPYACTGINADPGDQTGCQTNLSRGFGFHLGRHLQTVKIGTGRWQVHASCPDYPGKAYALVLSARGYRPGIKLPDGRRVHLNLDPLSVLSLQNLLRPLFDPGPLTLDASGRAAGLIDASSLPPVDVPLWIALAVLDPQAPCGLAFLPDTCVMRLRSR
ncbi:MAG: hypothetical protein JXQ29_11285 [Planctomycetes bacterium]|nr:hypothetical protein [Planctomycetota bacterium]